MLSRRTAGAPVPPEHMEQVALFSWARLQEKAHPALKLMYAIPNGGFRNKVTAALLKAEGVKKGVLDINLPVARAGYHGLFVEMKRTKGGTTSPEQLQWLAALNGEGYLAVVCAGWDEAREVILKYLAGAPD